MFLSDKLKATPKQPSRGKYPSPFLLFVPFFRFVAEDDDAVDVADEVNGRRRCPHAVDTEDPWEDEERPRREAEEAERDQQKAPEPAERDPLRLVVQGISSP